MLPILLTLTQPYALLSTESSGRTFCHFRPYTFSLSVALLASLQWRRCGQRLKKSSAGIRAVAWIRIRKEKIARFNEKSLILLKFHFEKYQCKRRSPMSVCPCERYGLLNYKS